MKNLNSLLAGIFLAVACPFGALVISSQVQLGSLGPAPAEEGGPLFPSREPGLAIQGRAVYVSLGCVSCHTQQVRPAGQGSDIARGYGVRASVARDYVQQKPVLLGERRIGPDLANYGARASKIDIDTLLRDPASSGAAWHPYYSYLYGRSADGKSIVPSERAVALVAYLKSLRQDYSSPEAKLKQ
jgi:cytochrome c oxidase cbb3-type subunit 2